MSEGQIPVGSGDLPIDTVPMEESAVYTGSLKAAAISTKLDKKGNVYAAIQVEVVDGDFEARTISMNYLALPVLITQDMSKGERIRAMDKGVTFERFCRAFGIKSKMPAVALGDVSTLEAWKEWVEKFYGNIGKFTVRNQEFPEGSGRVRSGINDFVF